ncbi:MULTISPECIES: DUF2516 family protein [Micromonosporaceae]|jgi:Protein of unknown function (DUF2516)|uniref:DUF2516 domain-containing protein n=1 Tax=Phytohabitans aurantiacus TaxID=3016789 RepID=A0ABQ5QT48_9ACTN|nr:DUF2516 family protein [Phytohabitans aurantiacus]MCW6007575.1 DUF2516 family protein [Micromonospora sp. CPCC 205371]GLH97460.1 hypothetical protein Pa4123_27350 [Phytohabitans aurantiacus]
MATTAPIFFLDVRYVIDLALLIFALVIEGVALVHCLTQRADAFPAIGTLPKGAWLAILGIALLFTLLFWAVSIFGLIGIAAAAIYLLDVRVGLRDLTDGKGFW